MTAPARGRARPVAVIGPVNVLAPRNDQRYYRLTWTNPDGTAGRTSGGTTLAAASAKATGLDVQLQQAAGSRQPFSIAASHVCLPESEAPGATVPTRAHPLAGERVATAEPDPPPSAAQELKNSSTLS